jgi:hypothetical protein
MPFFSKMKIIETDRPTNLCSHKSHEKFEKKLCHISDFCYKTDPCVVVSNLNHCLFISFPFSAEKNILTTNGAMT